MKKKIDMPKISVCIDGYFIISRYKQDTRIEEEDAMLFTEKLYENTEKCCAYVQLTDVRKMNTITREARDYYAKEGGKIVKCSAILLKDGFQKTLASMFTMFSKPKVETKYFTNEKKAIDWLNANL
jgi:SpoIIAA-like